MAKKSKKKERTYGKAPQGGARDDAPAAPTPAASGGSFWEGLKSLLLALALFLVLRSFVIQNFVITSGSMERTLLVGDFLMVNRVALGSRIPFTHTLIPGYSEPRRFEVIVFDPPHEKNLKLVKRLIGMPGDTLEMREKALFINGKKMEEPYVQHDGTGDEVMPWMDWQRDYVAPGVDRSAYRPTRDNWGPIVVPADHYFMLGDNRDTSLDSRYWGLLERWRLEGRAVFIYFSYNKGSERPFSFLREIRWERIGNSIR
jgi:signal peptidase I